MFYLFACTELDKQIETGDALLARDESKKSMIALAEKINAIDCYVMNANDVVIWQSWKDE